MSGLTSTRLNYDLDPLDIDALITDGWTYLRLYYSDEPDGDFVYTNVEVLLVADTYHYVFSFPTGEPGQWYKVLAWDGSISSEMADAIPFPGSSGTTLKSLRREAGQHTNDMAIATITTAVSTTSFKALNIGIIRYPDSHFVDMFLYRPKTGEQAICTASAKADGTFVYTPAFGTQVDIGEEVEITRRWTYSDYKTAVNNAIQQAYPQLSRAIVHTDMRTEEGIYVYDVPTDVRVVSRIEIEKDTQPASTDPRTQGAPWSEVGYDVITNGLQQQIEFKHQQPFEPDQRRLRLRGTGPLSQLYNETDVTEIISPATHVLVALTCHNLWSILPMTSSATDRDFYRQNAQDFKAEFDDLSKSFGSRQPKRLWARAQIWKR